MTRHMRLLLVSVAILLVVVPLATALAQGGEVMLVPYSSDMFGLTGLVPDGWQEAAPGVYQRGATPSDLTALIQQAAPGMSVDQLAAALLPNLRSTIAAIRSEARS